MPTREKIFMTGFAFGATVTQLVLHNGGTFLIPEGTWIIYGSGADIVFQYNDGGTWRTINAWMGYSDGVNVRAINNHATVDENILYASVRF